MKQTKRMLCLALSLIMLLSLFPASALADESVILSASEESQDDVLDVPNDDAALDEEDEVLRSAQDDEDAPALVRVVFVCEPAETVVTVYDPAQPDENGEPTVIDPEEDGSWLLLPGSYLYDATSEECEPVEKAEIQVEADYSLAGQCVYIRLNCSSDHGEDENNELRIADDSLLEWVAVTNRASAYSGNGSSSWDSVLWPTSSKRINALDHYSGGNEHGGIDIAAATGSKVYAVASGSVVRVGNSCSHTDKGSGHNCYANDGWGEYGNYIVIEHSIEGGTYTSVYAHLSQNSLKVDVGDQVNSGQEIALSGSSGSSTGPHLHLELYEGKFRGGIKTIRSKSFQYYLNNTTVLQGMTFSSHINTSSEYFGAWVEENCTLTNGVWKYTGTATSAGEVCDPPVINSVSTIDSSSLRVQWNSVPGATSYLVEHRIAGDETEYEVIAQNVTGNSFTDTGLMSNTKYWYRVYAVNGAGISGKSDSVSGRTRDYLSECTYTEASFSIRVHTVMDIKTLPCGRGTNAGSEALHECEVGEIYTVDRIYTNTNEDVWFRVSYNGTYGYIMANKVTIITIASGNCGAQGDNVTWTLDDAGTLTISGTGDMEAYTSFYAQPWNDYKTTIKAVAVLDGVTSIGAHAFSYCDSLTSVTIPSSVTSIGAYAFVWCSSLTSVTIPSSVTSIDEGVFLECSSLTSVTIPSSVTSIGWSAFCRCYNLTGVTIPSSVTSIADGAFYCCSGLTSVTIPGSVTSIGNSAFSGCCSLIRVDVAENNPNYCSVDGVLYTADRKKLCCVPGGRTGAFAIPAGVTSVGEGAVSNCSSLTSVTIPSSVTSIGAEAFWGCSSLTSVTIPSSVTSIGGSAFSGCSSLSDVYYSGTQAQWDAITIGSDNEQLLGATLHVQENAPVPSVIASGNCGAQGDNLTWTLDDAGTLTISGMGDMEAYTNYSAQPWNDYKTTIQAVAVLNGVTSVGAYAFSWCSSLTSVTIPSSVTSIGKQAFFGCSGLTSVAIPSSVTSIGRNAFDGCNSLTSITIPSSVTSIDKGAVSGCGNLKTITVEENNPNYCSVDGVLYSADRKALLCVPGGRTGSFVIPSSVTSIGDSAFYGCSSLTNVTIPESVTSIDSWAFWGCSSLTSVTIPTSVTSIGDHAFCYCGLTSVTIPNTVTNIGDSAFYDCSSLSDVYYTGTQAQWDAVTVGGGNEQLLGATLHVQSTEPENQPGFRIGSAVGHAGKTVTVPVSLENNPGIALFKVYVEYDEDVLEWTGIEHISLDGFWSAEVNKPVVWMGDGETEYDGNGEIFTLTFTVKDDAQPCETAVSLSYDPDDIQTWNEDLIDYENVPFAVLDGTVTIRDTVTAIGTVTAWNDSADAEVYLYAADTEDTVLNAATQSGDYSGAVVSATLGDVTASGKRYACTFSLADVEPGTYKLLVMKPGKYVPVIRSVTLEDDADLGEVKLWLYGDVTDDGKVNGTDALQIKRYFADISSVFSRGTEEEQAARLIAANVTAVRTGDNKVNGTDALQIQRYFADISSVFEYMR